MSLLLHEGELRVEAILKHHSLFRVLIAAAATLFLGAWLVLLFEENAKGSNIHNYPDALWWAIVTVTTVGYGDRFPVTGGGRMVAVVLMLVGIGLIGVLTATVASVFIKEHTDANKEEFKKGHADLGQQLSVISDRLADVERRLGATAGRGGGRGCDADAEAGARRAAGRPDPRGDPPPDRSWRDNCRHEGNPHPRRHEPTDATPAAIQQAVAGGHVLLARSRHPRPRARRRRHRTC